jgi:hypothetical protein
VCPMWVGVLNTFEPLTLSLVVKVEVGWRHPTVPGQEVGLMWLEGERSWQAMFS